MALIKSVRGFSPKWGRDCWFAENSTIVGDVVMGDECSVWFQAVIRGDVNCIRIGDRVNVQDGAVIHCTFNQSETIIGNDVTIGHNAIVHGCQIGDLVLIGMGSIVMDHAIVEDHCLIAAGAVVLEKSRCERGFLYAGVPAKKVKALDPETFANTVQRTAEAYTTYASWFRGASN